MDGSFVRFLSAAVPTAFAIGGAVAILLNPELRLPIIGLAASFIFGFTLNILIRSAENTKAVDDRLTNLDLKIDQMAAEVRASAKNQILAATATDDSRILPTQNFSDGLRLISEIGRDYPFISQFCDWKRQQLISVASQTVSSANDGLVIIDDPTYELTSSLELLKEVPEREVLAVSFEDTAFWSSSEGRNFLAEHKAAMDRNITITRVFIVDSSDEETLTQVMADQAAIGVIVYHVKREEVVALDPRDIVIYDDKLVRRGENTDYTASNMYKSAELVFLTDQILRERKKVEAIIQRAKRFEASSV